MASKCPFRLGQRVKELTSGVTGIITCLTLQTNGCWRVCIQPPADGNKLADAFDADTDIIELVDQGIANKAVTLLPQALAFNAKVRDKLSGFQGYITSASWHFNGCQYFMVAGKKLSDQGTILREYLPLERLELLRAPEDVPETAARPTGGPFERNAHRI